LSQEKTHDWFLLMLVYERVVVSGVAEGTHCLNTMCGVYRGIEQTAQTSKRTRQARKSMGRFAGTLLDRWRAISARCWNSGTDLLLIHKLLSE